MKNFKPREDRGGGFRGGNGGGKPSFGAKKSWSNDRGGNGAPARDRDVVMHKATCSHCGKSCEVPFVPSGDKPVFCRDCFNRTRDSINPRGEPSKYGNGGPRNSFSDRSAPREFKRPEFKSSPAPVANDDTKRQLAEIGSKLDRLINAMERMIQPKAEVKTEASAPIAKLAPVKAKAVAPKKKVVAKKK